MANKDKYKQLWLEEDLIAKADVYSKNIGTKKNNKDEINKWLMRI